MSSFSKLPGPVLEKLATNSTSIEIPAVVVALAASLTATYPTYAQDFELKYAAWRHARLSSGYSLPPSPNPHTSDRTPTNPTAHSDIQGAKLITAVNDIHALGPGTIPFLLTHFRDSPLPNDLYHALQTDDTLLNPRGTHATDAATTHWILNHYTALLFEFAHLARAWKSHQAHRVFPCCAFNTPVYRDLVAMGNGIVPLVMAEYARDRRGQWHELLFEIVNGRPSGATFYCQGEMFRFWKGWFEGGGGSGEGGEVGPPYVDGGLDLGKGGVLGGVDGDAGFGAGKAEAWEVRCEHHACCGGGV